MFLSITVDDGYARTVEDLLCLLARLDVRATFYLHCDRRPTLWPSCGGALATAGTIGRIISLGHEVGAHGFHHQAYPTLSLADKLRDLRATFQFWKDWGMFPRTFAYPFGLVDMETAALASEVFETAVIASYMSVDTTRVPYLIPRLPLVDEWQDSWMNRHLYVASVRVVPWLILMIHELNSASIERLEGLVEGLLKDGWKVDNVSRVFACLGRSIIP